MNTPGLPLARWLDNLLSEPVHAAKERARTAFDNDARPFHNRIVLFGAGNTGRAILARLRQDNIQPLAFSDSQSAQWGKIIDGLTVLSPDGAAERYGSNAIFIVTIYNNHHSFPETRDRLLSLGCEKVISVLSVRWKYFETFLPHFRDDLPYKVLEHADSIRQAFPLWSDELSRNEFVAQVAWRLHGDFDVLGRPDPESEYFPRDILPFRSDELFVDVGAYDGDTIRKFLSVLRGEFQNIVALEPDPHNFTRLQSYLSALPDQLAKKIEAKPLAAADRPSRLRFTEGEGTSAALSNRGTIEVDCVRLDDELARVHPTYIKMDIEGAELSAIEGCRHIIEEQSPMLAICVYHVQDHLMVRSACRKSAELNIPLLFAAAFVGMLGDCLLCRAVQSHSANGLTRAADRGITMRARLRDVHSRSTLR